MAFEQMKYLLFQNNLAKKYSISMHPISTTSKSNSIKVQAKTPIISVTLYSASGKEIKRVFGSGLRIIIPTKDVANGYYILEAKLKDYIFSRPILIR